MGVAVDGAAGVAVDDAVRDAVGVAVGDAVQGAVNRAMNSAVGDAVRGAVNRAMNSAVGDAVRGAVNRAMNSAVGDAVRGAVDDAVDDAVQGAVDDAVDDAVRDAVDDAVRDAVGDAVDGAVHGAVHGAVGGAVNSAVNSAVDGAVHGAVGGAVNSAVNSAVGDAVRDAVGVAVGGAVGGAVNRAVDDAVRDAVGVAVRDAVIETIRRSWTSYIGGQFWVGGWYYGSPAYVSFLRDVCGLDIGAEMSARADAYSDTAQSACWWWPHREFVMACEHPSHIDRDDRGRLHSFSRKAIMWPDGWGLYRIHGVEVPAHLVEHPEQLTVAVIDAEANAEVRRIMVDVYGRDRYVRDSGATLVHEDVDELGQPRRLWRRKWTDGRTMQLVEVLNSTKEPDGTRRAFLLGVHPETRPLLGGGRLGEPQEPTCHNAVASLGGLRGEQYHPEVQT